MSFSFDASLPTPRDHARLALGDADSTNPLLQDETIDAKLASLGYLEGLAQLADGLAVQAAQDPDRYGEGSAGLNAQWSAKVPAWQKLAEDCRSGRVADPQGGVLRSGAALSQLDAPKTKRFRPD